MKYIHTGIFFLLFLFISNHTYAQKFRGYVRDATDAPLANVNIIEKGLQNFTTTDVDGSYTLTPIGENAVLVFSLVGFRTQEIRQDRNIILNVTLQESTLLEGVEIVGSRSYKRTVTNSPVPVDLIDIREVTNTQGQLDLHQLLQFAAPSFNATRQSGSDGADHTDPASLRGLGPDQTLVLINGKRRHQSSLLTIIGTRGRGNTGTDLNAIPVAAIERIEILRDGAAAQYGSDAIAGVINIVLKQNVGELLANVNTGTNTATDEGKRLSGQSFDGGQIDANLNYGLKIGQEGYLNLTGEYLYRGRTYRPDSTSDTPRKYSGDAQASTTSLFANLAIPISKSLTFYGFSGYSYRFSDSYAFHRDTFSRRNVRAIYPYGFDPHIQAKVNDASASVGLRGTSNNGWNWDLNNTYGLNSFHYFVDKTLNTSLGASSPTTFDAGGFQLSQNTTTLDFSKNYPKNLYGMNVAFGAEYRYENYQINAGEDKSWQTYDKTLSGGAQGFPGFQPANVVNKGRYNLGIYGDLELNLTKRFMTDIALRFENYSDFGSTLNGKIAARFAVTPRFAFRGSLSTGYRAPSLAQLYFSQTFTNFVGGIPREAYIDGNGGKVATALGIPSLKQETSVNGTLGFTVNDGGFTASLDGYLINVKDRIILTGNFDQTIPEISKQLQALNVVSVQFFTNAVNTTTLGYDVVFGYTTNYGNDRLTMTFVSNTNIMPITSLTVNPSPNLAKYSSIYLSSREQRFLVASAPPQRTNITFNYNTEPYNFTLRLNYFGQVELENYAGHLDIYTPKATIDATVGYTFSKNAHASVGVSNLFNIYPDAQDGQNTEGGGIYDAVQMGIAGRYIFARIGFKF